MIGGINDGAIVANVGLKPGRTQQTGSAVSPTARGPEGSAVTACGHRWVPVPEWERGIVAGVSA